MRIALGLLLTILCSVTHAENYSVCENCVLTEANADLFESHYQGDYTSFAFMNYFNPEITDTKTSQIIALTLQKYQCHDAKACSQSWTSNAEIVIYAGQDPLKTYDPNADYKPVYVPAKVKVAGLTSDVDCLLGRALDPDGKSGYSYSHGVAVNCTIGLENYRALNFNLYFKRLK